MLVDAASLVSSVEPILETTREPGKEKGPSGQAKEKQQPHKSAMDRIKDGANSTECKMTHKGDSDRIHRAQSGHPSNGPGDLHGSVPKDDYGCITAQDAPVHLNGTPRSKQNGSDGFQSAKGKHTLIPEVVAGLALSSNGRETEVKKRQTEDRVRHRRSSKVKGLPANGDAGGTSEPRSRAEENPSWSQCFLSMAVCISK